MRNTTLMIAVIIVATLCAPAYAGYAWTMTSVHQAGWSNSAIWGGGDTGMVGRIKVTSGSNLDNAACFYYGGGNTNMHPGDAIAQKSGAASVGGGVAVGDINIASGDNHKHAYMFNAAVGISVDLNPTWAGIDVSKGQAGDANSQAGRAVVNGSDHAALWYGTAESFVDLNPTGCTTSYVNGLYGNKQFGYASSGNDHAGYWASSASSWTDLNPTGATKSRGVCGTGTKMGGMADYGTGWHAALWNLADGTAVDLNPIDAKASQVWWMSGDIQVGQATIGDVTYAGYWTGTAASWTTLAASGYTNTNARAIYVNGADIWIGGNGTNTATSVGEGLIWHTTAVPEPSSLMAIGLGGLGFLGGLIRRKRA